MKTKKAQKKSAKSRAGGKSQAKSGKGSRELSDASLDKVSGGVGAPRPRSGKRGGVADDSV